MKKCCCWRKKWDDDSISKLNYMINLEIFEKYD